MIFMLKYADDSSLKSTVTLPIPFWPEADEVNVVFSVQIIHRIDKSYCQNKTSAHGSQFLLKDECDTIQLTKISWSYHIPINSFI